MNNELTVIDPGANKLETKVFAGGMPIARQTRYLNLQQQNVDNIEWTAADPVTGTTAISRT